MNDTYRTLDAPAQASLTVDGSRFVAEARPADSRSAAEDAIAAARARDPDATHHCSAYRVGRAGDVFRYDDDGEPSGTAGRPILRQIDARDLTRVVVVVTRYYGGTKLGTGGLARAYGDAAGAALEAASIVERVVRVPVHVRFDYGDTSAVDRLLNRFDATVDDSRYTDVTELRLGVRASEADAFLDAFTNALSDRGTVLNVGDRRKE
jgi:uncharacterized YigZ family protein